MAETEPTRSASRQERLNHVIPKLQELIDEFVSVRDQHYAEENEDLGAAYDDFITSLTDARYDAEALLAAEQDPNYAYLNEL